MFVSTNSTGYAVFRQFLVKDISSQNLEVGFVFFAGDNFDDQYVITPKVWSKD